MVARTKPRLGLPDLGIGVGLRTQHYREILDGAPRVGFFEIISDNYMESAGRPLEFLDRIAERHPIVMHGVSLSIGSTAPLDRTYVRNLKKLRDRVHARWVSDHLCWTGLAGRNTHDLLPLPYTAESLRHVCERIRRVQDVLDAPLIIENPSTYVSFAESTMSEWEFIAAMCDRTGCGLLLDVNNIFVSARNHGFTPDEYLAAMPWDRVVQFHVAGHSDEGTHIVDTHDGPVIDPVWEILAKAWPRAGGASVLLEWDAKIPSFAEVENEAFRAHTVLPTSKSPRPRTKAPTTLARKRIGGAA
ncbi:MAG TPA: DUF692 domain-containing protein [Planctomycetota bacterium]|nr:DUF692 domain-containing protein [Planctomycetota bacterium]